MRNRETQNVALGLLPSSSYSPESIRHPRRPFANVEHRFPAPSRFLIVEMNRNIIEMGMYYAMWEARHFRVFNHDCYFAVRRMVVDQWHLEWEAIVMVLGTFAENDFVSSFPYMRGRLESGV